MSVGEATPGEKTGFLLVNLGTPDDPSPSSVRRYLRQFLSDARVVDIAAWRRFLALNLFILPFRPKKSGEAYAKIWTDRGSPLLFHGQDLAARVQARLGDSVQVELAMRYGRPAIAQALDRFQSAAVDRIVVFPLYPQYSSASTGSSVAAVFKEAASRWNTPYLQVVPPYYDHPLFIDAFARVARPALDEARPERVLFSFHGLPERQIRKGDRSRTHCLARKDCCARIGESNRYCYRAQCVASARALADLLGIPPEQRIVCFQSRLGRTPWIRPYTDEVVIELAQAGIRRAAILSPAFTADCLETLEELGMRAAASFVANGGESLRLVPSLNATDAWVDAVAGISRDASNWIPGDRRA